MKQTVLWSGVVLLALFASGCNEASSTQGSTSSTTASTTTSAKAVPDAKPAETAPAGAEVLLPGGLKYVDLKIGDGDIAEKGMTATVHYTGWLTDRNTPFDSSVGRNQPFPVHLGAGGVIRGWDEGIPGMRIGGKRHLTIPPDMAYGSNGYPPVIPPNATLQFDIELLSLAK